MIKTGIYKFSQLEKKNTTIFGKLKKVSITLYEQILNQPNLDDYLAEEILLLFSDERGAYKRTYQKRFEIFDAQTINILKKFFNSSSLILFHDVAVSDGRTALDFFDKMIIDFPEIQYLASDYSPSVYIIEKGNIKITFSCLNKILEIVFPPFVFNTIRRDSLYYYPLNRLIQFFIEKFFINNLILQYQQGIIKAKQLFLFAPKVLEKAKKDRRFKVEQHDLLLPFKNSYDIIRAMNILNASYFSDNEFQIIVKNLYTGLNNNGIFITGSNQETGSLVHGSIYQKSKHGFNKIFQSGEGSPIERFIVNFKFD